MLVLLKILKLFVTSLTRFFPLFFSISSKTLNKLNSLRITNAKIEKSVLTLRKYYN